MDVMQLRRNLLMQQQSVPSELYPVGTDVITMFIGRDENGRGLFNSGYIINAQGEYTTGNGAASDVYIPIDPTYTYTKSANRIYIICYYDKDKQFISVTNDYSGTTSMDISNIPSNAAYIRFYVVSNSSQWILTLTRTA